MRKGRTVRRTDERRTFFPASSLSPSLSSPLSPPVLPFPRRPSLTSSSFLASLSFSFLPPPLHILLTTCFFSSLLLPLFSSSPLSSPPSLLPYLFPSSPLLPPSPPPNLSFSLFFSFILSSSPLFAGSHALEANSSLVSLAIPLMSWLQLWGRRMSFRRRSSGLSPSSRHSPPRASPWRTL